MSWQTTSKRVQKPSKKILLIFWWKQSKPGEKHINHSIYLCRAPAPTLPSLHCVRTHIHTYRAVSKHGKLSSKHRLCPIYPPVILHSLQTKPVTRETNTNSHTSDKIFPSSYILTLSEYGFIHLYRWLTASLIQYFHTHEKKDKWGKGDKRRLFGSTWLDMQCLFIHWQPRIISAYSSLWQTWTVPTTNKAFEFSWPSTFYTKLKI